MTDPETLDERLRAVERTLTGDDRDLTDLRTGAELARELEAVGDRLDDAEDRLDDLDAATQALRGYVGNVRAVNEAVERRADAALAKAESLERDDRPDDRVGCDCERRRPAAAVETTDSAGPTEDNPEAAEDDPDPFARLAEALW